MPPLMDTPHTPTVAGGLSPHKNSYMHTQASTPARSLGTHNSVVHPRSQPAVKPRNQWRRVCPSGPARSPAAIAHHPAAAQTPHRAPGDLTSIARTAGPPRRSLLPSACATAAAGASACARTCHAYHINCDTSLVGRKHDNQATTEQVYGVQDPASGQQAHQMKSMMPCDTPSGRNFHVEKGASSPSGSPSAAGAPPLLDVLPLVPGGSQVLPIHYALGDNSCSQTTLTSHVSMLPWEPV